MLSISDLFSSEFLEKTRSEEYKNEWWNSLHHFHLANEAPLLDALKQEVSGLKMDDRASNWISEARSKPHSFFSINEIMSRFGLNTDEGIVLLALAEALLRIPDNTTAEAFIKDRLDELDLTQLIPESGAGWIEQSTFWGLALSRNLISEQPNSETSADSVFSALWRKLGKSSLQGALKFAIESIGKQFVFAETINEALDQCCDYSIEKTAFSFDMLGEAALCDEDVDYYFSAYLEAIQTTGERESRYDSSISIKLSALHPRLENSKWEDVQKKLIHRLLQLIVIARNLDVAITIDAEESYRLELSLLIFESLLNTELCRGWGKLGLAVQAYSKRTLPLLGWLTCLADQTETPIPVRLVKGAYWDSEIKHAQQHGLSDYPVFTQKAATDLSYLACSHFLLSNHCPNLLPQFATHNAATVAFIQWIGTAKAYEFQRLHGMGVELYDAVLKDTDKQCRIYAPVGAQQTLLPYLVRRLLENGANSSFVFQLNDPSIDTDKLLQSPLSLLKPASTVRPPADLFLPERLSSKGTNLDSLTTVSEWQSELKKPLSQAFSQPIIAGELSEGENLTQTFSPYKLDQAIGYVGLCSQAQLKQAISSAECVLSEWQSTDISERAAILRRYAELLETHKINLVTLCIKEAGKCLQDALDEVREAIDFCYYYANQAEQQLKVDVLPAITGESNTLSYQGRGAFLCISPWNFPLAIFTGQVAAALVSGNTVIAKPASECTLLAFKAAELWHQAGLPPECLQFTPFASSTGAETLLSDSRIAGVAFTGSTTAAHGINLALSQRPYSALPTVIAETGGQNAMIVDSTALPEQIVKDAIRSAFNSAGQRCSALRVLYVQSDIADDVEAKLIGAMKTLSIGNPELLSTDVGPVITKQAMDNIFEHIERHRVLGQLVYECPLDDHHNNGYFVPPTLLKLRSLDELTEEVFGPVLHIIRYDADQIDRVINEINRTGYGLTLGIHSRNDSFITNICEQVDVGNIYINRDQIGATVAAQPFGGMGLSGTGPKAGGPNYLKRFVREKTTTRNTTASGGNLALLQEAN